MEDWAAKKYMRERTISERRGGYVLEQDMHGNLIGNTRPQRPMVKTRGESKAKVEMNPRDRITRL